jgi:lipid II:glycine glycyltransferase (peptidoglycan interpeptide bridge formation enzyme)
MVCEISMVRWEVVDNKMKNNWDNILYSHDDGNYFQADAWSMNKSESGWGTFRFIAYDENKQIVGCAQFQVRYFPFSSCIAWCQGGPIGDNSVINNNLLNLCLKEFGCSHVYIRISPMRDYSKDFNKHLINHGWIIPKYRMTSGLSMILDLDKDEDILVSKLSKNWKRNLKRFKEDGLTIELWENPNIDEIINLYSRMVSYKKIKEQYSKENLTNLFKYLGDNILTYRCVYNGDLIGIRAAIIYNDKGWDLLAATDQIARKKYVSYKLFWLLLMKCKDQSVKNYDLSGIDPISSSGVYNFKKGTGAVEVKYIGEWEWSTSYIMRLILNFIIKFKKQTY